MDLPDLSELIIHEHRVIDGLLAALSTDREDRFILAHRLIDELSAHTAAETQVLHPALRDIVPGGAEMADIGQRDHEAIRVALTALERGQPGDPGFEDALGAVARHMGDHVPVEENEHLPALSSVIGPEAMAELGLIYSQVRETVPMGLQGLPATGRDPRFTL